MAPISWRKENRRIAAYSDRRVPFLHTSSFVELVIVILFVRTLEGALSIEVGGFIWEHLVLPMGILMLALAFKFMGFGN